MSKSNYVAICEIYHNQIAYPIGSRLELTDDEAKPLLAHPRAIAPAGSIARDQLSEDANNLVNISALSVEEVETLVQQCGDQSTLNQWLDQENARKKPRIGVQNAIANQLTAINSAQSAPALKDDDEKAFITAS